MREIDQVLNDNEKVLWEGTPQFTPFVMGGGASGFVTIILFIVGLFLMLTGLIPILIALASGIYWLLLLPHFWLGVAIAFGPILYRWLVYRYTYYAITDKRLIFQTGFVGRDFQFVDFDQISNAEVNVDLFDKLFGKNSGSIRIMTAGSFTQGKYGPVAKPYILASITDPYTVFKFFKKVSYDVKTDVSFPNKYRPSSNPGYKTSYSPKKK